MANSCRFSSGIFASWLRTTQVTQAVQSCWPLKMLHNCRRNKRRLRCCERKWTLIPLHLIVSTRDFQLRPPWKSFIIYGFSYPAGKHLPTHTHTHTYTNSHSSLLSIIENLSKLWPVIDFNGFSICPYPQIESVKKNKCASSTKIL